MEKRVNELEREAKGDLSIYLYLSSRHAFTLHTLSLSLFLKCIDLTNRVKDKSYQITSLQNELQRYEVDMQIAARELEFQTKKCLQYKGILHLLLFHINFIFPLFLSFV